MNTTANLLFIDATVRSHTVSRTWQLCSEYLKTFKNQHPLWNIQHLKLIDMSLQPKTKEQLTQIEQLLAEKKIQEPCFAYARDFAAADRILIGAPYWDFSFPAVLKIYIENICMNSITFTYENDQPKGLCRASRLDYISTAGGCTSGIDLGSEYICKVCSGLLGIKQCTSLIVDRLDIEGNNTAALMQDGIRKAQEMALQ